MAICSVTGTARSEGDSFATALGVSETLQILDGQGYPAMDAVAHGERMAGHG
jgi:hypothetical protein